MSTDRDDNGPGDAADRVGRSAVNKEAEALGVQKHSHGDVDEWLDHNWESGDDGPVAGAAPDDHAPRTAAASRSTDPADDNLVQLPIGARFHLDHEPSPREREDMLRFAADADAELHGHDAHAEGGRRPEPEPGSEE